MLQTAPLSLFQTNIIVEKGMEGLHLKRSRVPDRKTCLATCFRFTVSVVRRCDTGSRLWLCLSWYVVKCMLVVVFLYIYF